MVATFHREQQRKDQIARCVPHHTSRPQGLPLEDFPGHGCGEDTVLPNELDGGDKKTDVEDGSLSKTAISQRSQPSRQPPVSVLCSQEPTRKQSPEYHGRLQSTPHDSHSASIFKLQERTKKLKGGNHQGDVSRLRKDITALAAVKEQNEQNETIKKQQQTIEDLKRAIEDQRKDMKRCRDSDKKPRNRRRRDTSESESSDSESNTHSDTYKLLKLLVNKRNKPHKKKHTHIHLH